MVRRGKEGKLKTVITIAEILGKKGLHELGFNIPKSGKVMARQPIILNRVERELPSASDVAKADDIELQEIKENAARSMEDLITQLEDPQVTHSNILCTSFWAWTRS